MTVCQKNGQWKDADCGIDGDEHKCTSPSWKTDPSEQLGFAVFETQGAPNAVWEHIEWDKAPRGTSKDAHHLGEGDGWLPFYFSQCCSTVAIAPEV